MIIMHCLRCQLLNVSKPGCRAATSFRAQEEYSAAYVRWGLDYVKP